MPVMIRTNLSKKIAFSIIGKPNALQIKQSEAQRKASKVANRQEARLAR